MLWDIFDIEKIVLRYDRQDRAQNQIPIFADGDRNDWLNVEGELVAVMRRSIAKVFVRLKRDADQRRNGIRQLFGELVCLIRVRFDLGSIGGVEPANRQKKSGEDGAQSAGRRIVLHIHAIRLGVVLNWRRQLSRAPADWRALALSVTAFN